MAYQLNSANDAQGDEGRFLVQFNQNRPAIEAYKRQHGGSLEYAFLKVTGTPWPKGRSVKLSHGAPEMTKDRTVKSVLGKYVAPIAAGALTGGAAFGLGPLSGAGGVLASSSPHLAAATGAPLGPAAGAATMGLGRTALKYGAQYGLPVVGDLINGRRQSNATRDAARMEQEYLDKALAQAKEEQLYRRGFDEDGRQYARRIDEYERSKYEESTGYDRGKYGDATGYDREKYNEGEGYKRAQYNEGTNYNRRNYGNFAETLEPYRAGGQAANQFASRLMGQNVPEYTGGTYYDVARDARTPVNLPTDVNLRTNVNVPTGAPGLSFPGSTGGAGEPVSTTMPVGGTGGGGASGYMARDWTSGQLTGPDGRVVNLPTGGEQFDVSPEYRERLRMLMENGEIQTRGGGSGDVRPQFPGEIDHGQFSGGYPDSSGGGGTSGIVAGDQYPTGQGQQRYAVIDGKRVPFGGADGSLGQSGGGPPVSTTMPVDGEQFSVSPEYRERLRMLMENGEIQTRGGGRRA
jgi:hypothetical protein